MRTKARANTNRVIVYDYNEETNEAVPSYLPYRLLNMNGPRWAR
jgi:hypothetical protein